jgi:hypothetical protein
MPGAVVRAQAQGAIPPPRTGHVGVPKRAESGWDAWRPGRRERERERERELYWEQQSRGPDWVCPEPPRPSRD